MPRALRRIICSAVLLTPLAIVAPAALASTGHVQVGASVQSAARLVRSSARAQQASRAHARYIVQRGDTLYSIAAAHLGSGSAWQGLYAANRAIIGADPNLISIGLDLNLTTAAPVAAAPSHTSTGGRVWGVTYGHPYRCGDGDGDGWDMSCAKLYGHPAHAAHARAAAPAAAPAVAAPAPAPAAPVATGGVWGCIAQHESGDTNANTGNGFYGYFQFTEATWQAVTGMGGVASDYSYATQLQAAIKLQAESGWGNWPVTSVECGV